MRVISKAAPTIGETVSVIRGNGAWWYQSSTGLWLARCAHTGPAAEMLNIILTPWLTAASHPHKNDQR
ncbi:hypothetical protein [Actinomadura roseirufa]|uniref:hypothetical protein n=1 Tax=Actinomadura roseirufa TaxID=2094049 RepID=UPI0010417530|nr:hypothetical protein [Actinomadura roseirufa]